MQDLKAPFPYFGGKKRIAAEVWARLGAVENYVEPFFGSGAVLLSNPARPKTETICDKDHFIANLWRAIRMNPALVTFYASRPVNEVELHVNHDWLINDGFERIKRIETDCSYYDAEVAGVYLWGACCWIGDGWASGNGPWSIENDEWIKPEDGRGITRQIPHLGDRGKGINKKLPHLGDRGRGINRPTSHFRDRDDFIFEWLSELSIRLRDVRITCGDWKRITGPSITTRLGVTGIFLDPPYSVSASRKENIYREDDLKVAHEAARWAIENGENAKMRIVFAGYEGEHDFPENWDILNWKAPGGYGSQGEGRGRENSGRECLWISPNCLDIRNDDERKLL